MTNSKSFLLSAVLILLGFTSFSQVRIQVVHNSADAALEMVDVWLDQTLIIDNFKFRTASPFMDAPAGVEFTIAIAGPDSQNPDNPLWSHTYTLTDGETYVLVAEGIISTSGYDPATPFDIAVFPDGREVANLSDMTDMLVNHGSTDAPVIDIYERTGIGSTLIVDNIAYGEFDGYIEMATNDYIFEVRDETGSITMAAYSASFQMLGLKGKAITMVASGFLDPASNSNGPAFGLWVAPAEGGNLIELPVYNPTARVQIIHNSADAATAVVDVWLNQTLLLDNFAFRTASPYIDLPADQEITIAIAGPDSQDPDNPLWSHTYNLTVDQTYILVAEGIISSSGYDPATPFDIAVFPQGREIANNSDKTDMLVQHGSTDSPIVDIYETGIGLGLLVDNISYSEFAGYMELEPQDYIFEVRDQAGITKLAAFRASFGTLGLDGDAVTVVASGFMDPENNSNGAAFGLWLAKASGGNLIELPAFAPKARIQLIHNSADAAAEVVDVWLNDELILDNFAFRTASPFIDAPAGEEFTLAVKGPDSQNPDNPLWSHTYTLTDEETYILVAEGIISASGYDPAPPFDIAVYPQGREQAVNGNQTDMLIHHGSTDTPTIDIVEVGIGFGIIVDNISYSEFAGYFGLATVNYIFQIRDETGMTKIAAYEVPLATLGLQGDAVSVIASGFLEPENNSNGPGFGLYIALASGGALVKLPEYAPKARVQIIHNSADTAVDVVDVWLNQTLLLDNFAFRTASPFIDAPADEQFTIAVKGADSQDPYNPLWSHNYNLTEGETYIMVAEGIQSETGYDPAPPFAIAVYPTGRETANLSGQTDMLVHHGATDAPVIDLVETGLGAGLLVDNLAYTEFSGYLELPTIDYIFDVRDETGTTTFATYRAPFATLGFDGAAISVMASGFLNPANNSNGPALGLWAALASGGPLVELPLYVPSARVQFIHNSADAAASVVDVWMNQTLLLDNFAFRTASPFMYIPAGQEITIAIKGPDSQDPDSPLYSQNLTLTVDETYILVADGIISASGYDPAKPFNIFVYEGAVEEASLSTNTDILVFHGATDAPTVDVVEIAPGTLTLVENLAYGNFDGYLDLTTANYSLNITDEPGTTVLANFIAPLADLNLDGQSLTVLASGFLDPAANSNGPAFGLLAVQVDGTSMMLTNTAGVSDSPLDISTFNIYPNPAADHINVSFELKAEERVSVEILDITGRIVKLADLGMCNTGVYNQMINVKELNSGMYLLNIRSGEGVISKKLFKQ
jgi:hypothetical protein